MEFKWYWVIPVTVAIVGFFGIFWTTNLADARIEIDLSMDNNSLEAMHIVNRTQYSEPVPIHEIEKHLANMKCEDKNKLRDDGCISGCMSMYGYMTDEYNITIANINICTDLCNHLIYPN